MVFELIKIEVQCNKYQFKIFTPRSWSFWKLSRKGTSKAKPQSKLKNIFTIYLQRKFALPSIECKWQFFANMYKFSITKTQPFLLRIHANFYGTPTRSKKVTYFDSKLFFLRKFVY